MDVVTKELLEACQVALMNLEGNTKEHELWLTKRKLERAIKAAGGEKWSHPMAGLLDSFRRNPIKWPTGAKS